MPNQLKEHPNRLPVQASNQQVAVAVNKSGQSASQNSRLKHFPAEREDHEKRTRETSSVSGSPLAPLCRVTQLSNSLFL